MKQREKAERVELVCDELRTQFGVKGETHFTKKTSETAVAIYDACVRYCVPYPLVKRILFGR